MRKLLTLTSAVCAALLVAAPVGADEEEDQAAAEDVVAVTGEIVPPGFEEDEPSDEDDTEGPEECEDVTQAVDDAKERPFAEVAYTDPADVNGLTEAGASVYVFPKAKQAKRLVRTLSSGDALACAEAAAATFSENATVEEIELDNASGVEITAESEGLVFVIQQLQVRVGRGVVLVSAISPDAPLDFVEDLTIALEEALFVAVQ